MLHLCDHSPMRAFEVHLNGKKLCLAGIGDDGALTTSVNSVGNNRRSDLFLQVGGLINPSQEHVSWVRQRPLRAGDKITVRIVEKKAVDDPTIKFRFDATKELKNEKIYVRKMAKKLGGQFRFVQKTRRRNDS
jgi:hypothetical protein